jgi:alkaline phosphatase
MSFVMKSISDDLGIKDASDAEITNLVNDPDTALYQYADMVSRRSQTGWSTHGHSAADVNIYSSENTEVGDFLRDYLGVDVEAVTRELREKGTQLMVADAEGKQVSWMGRLPDQGERLDGQNHVAAYAGDFRKRHFDHGGSVDVGCRGSGEK